MNNGEIESSSAARIADAVRAHSDSLPWNRSPIQRRAKRILDIVVSSALLILTLPVSALLCLVVRLTSPGPVFFVQDRMGQDGLLFRMYKFRTMTDGKADGSAHDLMEVTATDPRLTSVGGFLRASRLDELPQLLHVLIGDMSLVGPRPDIPQNADRYQDEQLVRFAIPQGCTTWGVVRGGLLNDWNTRQDINVEYALQWSFWLDIKIILQTFFVLVLQKGTNPESPEN